MFLLLSDFTSKQKLSYIFFLYLIVLCIAVLQETTSSEVFIDSTNASSYTSNNRVGSAASIGLGVILSLIGLAAILILLVLLRRRFGWCQNLNYRFPYFAVNFEAQAECQVEILNQVEIFCKIYEIFFQSFRKLTAGKSVTILGKLQNSDGSCFSYYLRMYRSTK